MSESVAEHAFESMLFRSSGAVAEIVLSRPDRRNATDLQFYLDLLACLDLAGFHLLPQADFGGTMRQTEDWLEVKRAFQERRKPEFKGR